MSDIRKTLDKLNEMTAGSVATVATPLFKETVKREKTDETADSGKKYMNSVERGASEWGNWASSKKKKTVAEATNPTTGDEKKVEPNKKQLKQQTKADTKQQAQAAFGSMFGGGNPADKLGIRKESVEESSENTQPKLGTVKANMMNTKEPTVQVQVYKHNTLRGDSYWVTKEVKKFKTMNQAQAYVDRINKQGVVEGSHDKKSTVTTFVIGCDWNKVVEWLEKNIGQTTLKSPNHINGWYGQGWALFLNPSRYEPGKLAFQVRANTDLSEEELKSQIEMFSKAVVEGDNQINELSPATVLRYAKAVAADAQKHDMDPTKRPAEKRNQSVVGFSRALNRLPKVSFFNKEQDVDESWKISTPIDKERYTDMSDQGLEGPFRLKSGKIVYYDPKEGKYYDRDTDMYMDYDEYQSHTNEEELMELGYEGNIGAMEMVKFFKMADPRQKEILNQLIKEKEFQRAWALIQGVTGDKLVGKEFSEGEIAEQLSEDLRAWFGKGGEGGAGGGGWDRYNTKGERIGKCGERKAGEGKPKCLSKEKAASLRASGGKKAIAAAVRKKRREDPNPQRQGKADMVSNKTKNESLEYYVKEGICPQCNGEMVSEALFTEGKKDACYHKVKSRYKIWPSAYASGALVKCRKAGAKNWGNKSKNESINEGRADDLERALMQARKITKGIAYDNTVNEIMVEIEELIKTYNLDMDDFNYHNSRVYEAKHELESAIYGLDEIFEDALRDAQYSDEEGLNEQDLIVMPGKMRMRGDVVKAKHMEPDHEVSMAVNSLLSTIKNAMSLAKIIKGRSEGQGLPGWVSDHITRADELIKDVAEYMEGHEAQKNMLEGKKNVKR